MIPWKLAFIKLTFLIPVVFCPLVSALEKPNASFDCTKTELFIEEIICSDNELASLDYQMADLYVQYKDRLGDRGKKELLEKQRKWLLSRFHVCEIARFDSPTKEVIDCLKIVYQNRIGYLHPLVTAKELVM